MDKSIYSPDKFMCGLYESLSESPYDDVTSENEAIAVSENIKSKATKLFNIDKLPKTVDRKAVKIGETLDYGSYICEKYSIEICQSLNMVFYLLTPKHIRENAPGVVALCGHGYGVRQIVNVTKNGKKKKLRYFDNYQKSFACELAKCGCIVVAPELFGFGEARLKKDLKKPFYISSCDELSHHLLPYGLTTATVRIYQAISCVDFLYTIKSVDRDRIGCMGISGGGLCSLYTAVLDERIKRIAVSGYINTFRDSILSRWHCPDNYIPGILTVGEIYDFAASLAPRPLLIESGIRDKLFPIEASRIAHKKIEKIYSVMGAQDKLITDVFDASHSVNGKISFEFFN